MDPTTGVQPQPAPVETPTQGGDPGQGAQQGDLTGHLLSSVSPAFRTEAERLLGEWNRTAQTKFQEAADYRKQWEPFEPLGINQVPVEELQELLQFRQIAQDPQQFSEWHRAIGEMLAEGQQEDPAGAEDDLSGIPPQLQQQLDEFQQWKQQQEEQQLVQQQAEAIRGQLDTIRKDHPQLTDEDEEFICSLALKYEDRDAVQKGFADYQSLMTRAERGMFQQKSESPEPAVQGGGNPTAPEPVSSFEQAGKMAMERIRQSQSV